MSKWTQATRAILIVIFWGLMAWEIAVLIGIQMGAAPSSALISPMGMRISLRWPFVAAVIGILAGHILVPRRAWMPWPPPPRWGLPVVLSIVGVIAVLNLCGIAQPPPEVCAVAGLPLGHFLWAQTPPAEEKP